MRIRIQPLLIVSAVAASGACGPATQQAPEVSNAPFSAEATSPLSVELNWQEVDGADSYLLEGRYGGGEYFQVAELPGDQTSFLHFVIPGNPQVSYRLSAGAGLEEIEPLTLSLPDLAPSPLAVQPVAAAPTMPELPELPVFPTPDLSVTDPVAIATAMAALADMGSGLDPSDSAALAQPAFVQTEIGPDGGEVTMTDSNGVTYSLAFPMDAVHEPTGITLVPIESIDGLPFAGGILAGVQIHPPIPFAGPATMTITLPPDSPSTGASRISGFAVSNLSSELSLIPIYNVGQVAYRMSIYWGDTVGLASATLDEIASQAARIPTDSLAQMFQQLAALRASDLDLGPEADVRSIMQVLHGFPPRTEVGTRILPGSGVAMTALALAGSGAPALQYETPQKLFASLFWGEALWNWLQQMLHLVPGAPPPPGEIGRELTEFETRIVDELTRAIKAFIDAHDGCRTGLGLYSEALRQILRSPGTAFQQALANEYRARYGPPPDLQCEFRLQITRSSIKEFRPGADYLGDDLETYAVHSEPWSLDLAMRDGRLFLQGTVGIQYDSWEVSHSRCPPTVQLRPFPTSLIRITDLSLVFDDDDRVADLVLQGVALDRLGSNTDSEITVDQPRPGECRLLSETAGTNPTDVWGMAFASLHNPGSKLDSWVITGEDSYVATDTIAGRVEGNSGRQLTEDTTIVLTVNQR